METIAVSTSNAQAGILSIPAGQETELVRVLTVEEFIEQCVKFNEEHPEFIEGLRAGIQKGTDCPVHHYAEKIGQHACKSAVPGIRICPICQKPICPCCGNHSVTQLSRVTGYIGEVGGWNVAKKQELLDRQRYNIGVGGSTSSVSR